MDFQSNSTFRTIHPIPIFHYVMVMPFKLNLKLGNELRSDRSTLYISDRTSYAMFQHKTVSYVHMYRL